MNDDRTWGPGKIWTARLIFLAVFFAAAIVFVIVVDPFQQYHVSTRFEPRFYSLHHRFINPGLAKNAAYDTIATGSSIEPTRLANGHQISALSTAARAASTLRRFSTVNCLPFCEL